MTPTNDPGVKITVATTQGSRDYQEDRAVHSWCPGKGWLLGIFDGHGGAATAVKVSESLLPSFEVAWTSSPNNVAAVLREMFSSFVHLTQQDLSGTTASILFIPENTQSVWWGVLGDSPIAVMDSQGVIHVGPDHNVRTNPEELAAAQRRGGHYRSGYLEDPGLPGVGLQMARSLGDATLARVLNREPEISEVPLGGRGIVLVGSDGLISPTEESPREQLARLIRMAHKGATAEDLVNDAIRRRTGDNATSILWRRDNVGEGLL
jgi:serine/threonine protein phosphatase PrpC